MCNSFFSYLSPVWGTSLNAGEANRLQIAQNKSIRTIFSYEYNVLSMSTVQIMKKFAILSIKELIEFNNVMMIYKIDNGMLKSNHKTDRRRVHN